MSSKLVQTCRAWTEKEREDIRAYHPLHPDLDSDADKIQDVPVISYKTAPEGLKALRLFRLQNPHVNLQKAEQRRACYIEKKGILRAYKASLGGGSIKQQSRDFLALSRKFLSFCVYILL